MIFVVESEAPRFFFDALEESCLVVGFLSPMSPRSDTSGVLWILDPISTISTFWFFFHCLALGKLILVRLVGRH